MELTGCCTWMIIHQQDLQHHVGTLWSVLLVCAGLSENFTASKSCEVRLLASSQVFHSSGPPQSSLNVGLCARAWPQKIKVFNMEDTVRGNCTDTAEQAEGKEAVILLCWSEMQVKRPLWIGHAALPVYTNSSGWVDEKRIKKKQLSYLRQKKCFLPPFFPLLFCSTVVRFNLHFQLLCDLTIADDITPSPLTSG